MCPSKNSRIINSLLARLHGAMSTQACLANTGGIMSLYMRHVSHQVQSGSEELSALLESVTGHQRQGLFCQYRPQAYLCLFPDTYLAESLAAAEVRVQREGIWVLNPSS